LTETNAESSAFRDGVITAALFLLIAITLSGVLPLWLDEILQLMTTKGTSVPQLIASIPNSSGSAPLGYLTQREILSMTQYSVRMARLPSALFMSGTVFLIAFLGVELGVKRPWLAAMIFATLPLTIRYGTEARVYAQAVFFSMLASLIYLRMAKPLRGRLSVYYFAALVS